MLKDFLHGKPLRHPLHTFLVHFPISLLVLSLVLDLSSLAFSSVPGLVRGAFYALLVGIVAALLAAIPGFVDYNEIPRDGPSRRIATAHMALNLIAVFLFAVGAGLRWSALDMDRIAPLPLVLSIVAVGLLMVSGYLGGCMVYDDGVGVGRHLRKTPAHAETLRFSTADAASKKWEQRGEVVLVPVVGADGLEEHDMLRVEIDRQVMVIVKINGRFHAFQEFCTHRFGPLSMGHLDGETVVCPWHRSCFDAKTGKVTDGPAKVDLKSFDIEMRDGKVCVAMPQGPSQVPGKGAAP
jgi:uncharacterized membrane protein/nitrite reductase/ring-hydroxylating ferredoxin subunit